MTLLLTGSLVLTAAIASGSTVYAETAATQQTRQLVPGESSGSINYSFSGTSKDKAGYAEGTITLKADKAATYKLYWSDDTKALDGFYPIDELTLKSGESKSVKMGYHTAIPAGATKIIATSGSLFAADAYTVYDIPEYKRLSAASGKLLYTFSTFSDVHIDKGSLWYVNAETNLKQGLAYSVKNDADYIVISGDCVTNDSGPDKEWNAYNKILSKSDFVNPIWESDGNHDMRQGVSSGLKSFMKGSGTDGSDSGKPYFYRVEETTGDLFIFMALELNKSPNQAEEFSDEQMAWAAKLIEENYQDYNIFLIQHSPIKGYGAGDRMSKPYYSGMLNQDHKSTQKFKKLLQDYPNVVFLSGHTHEDFVMDYNYFDDGGNAAHMIHTPSLAGSTMPDSSDTKLERNGGKGFHSQAYFTEVYQNEIVFYGVNILKELRYPKYTYIMEGSRTSESPISLPAPPRPLKNNIVDITSELSKASYVLSEYYLYASYDSYQYLKNYYYQYKDKTTADESIIDEFEDRIAALSKYTGDIGFYTLYKDYYFVNNNDWSNVYLYAWSGSTSNASWPGVKLSKTGTLDNKNVYKISFNTAGEYKNIILNNGSNSKQTVDISLPGCKYNGFKLNGTDNGKYKVSNFKYETGTEEEEEEEDPKPENDRYALLYYVSGVHGWDKTDTFLKKDGSVYKLTYTQTSENNFSFSLYDKSEGKYYSLTESLKFTYEKGLVKEAVLSKQSSRGKSVTVYGMNKDVVINIEYDPSSKNLKVICGMQAAAALSNTSEISEETLKIGGTVTVKASSEGGSGEYTYAVSYKKASSENWTLVQDFSTNDTVTIKPAKALRYDILVQTKDESGKVDEKILSVNVFDVLKNTSTVASENIGFGDTVTVNARASGGLGEYTYAVYYKKSTSDKWTNIQKFSENACVAFKPAAAVSYDVMVKAQDERGVIVKKVITVNVTKPENTSELVSDTVSFGSTIDINCSASGGSGVYEYAVICKKASSDKWTTKQNYSENASVSFKPAVKTKYDVCVKAKDSLGNISKKYFEVKVK